MKNEFGITLDRNGYAPSVLITESGTCYICLKHRETVRHEVYFGTAYRSKSKVLGAWVNLCPECHSRLHAKDSYLNYDLKRVCQYHMMKHYDWTVDDFRERFGKSYVEIS